jgi:alcohol dehydrogenase
MLPSVMRFNAVEVGGLYEEFGGVESLATTVQGMLTQAGLPTRLSEHGAPREDLPQLAAEAAAQWTAQFNPRAVDAAALEEIYRCAW